MLRNGTRATREAAYEAMLKKIDELVRALNVKVYKPEQELLTITDVTGIRDRLLERQRPNAGYWPDPICREYGTAMACIILQTPNNCVPRWPRGAE